MQGHVALDLCLRSSLAISYTLMDVLISQADLVPSLGQAQQKQSLGEKEKQRPVNGSLSGD